MRNQMISFILGVLCGQEGDLAGHIAYGHPADAPLQKQRIWIVPSGFFNEGTYGTPASLPGIPLAEIETIPLLYGQPKIERFTGADGIVRLVVYADIIASSYFLLTRFEEVVRREVRDEHGRFLGKESLPFRAGFLQRPIVDEYAALLRKWLRSVDVEVAEPPTQIRKIYLTHDVDAPWTWPTFRSAVKAALSNVVASPAGVLVPLLSYWGLMKNRDPKDCFQWILEQDAALRDALGAPRVESIFFMLAGGGGPHDGADYLKNVRAVRLIKKIKKFGATLGLHSSYSAGLDPGRVAVETARLSRATGCPCRANRHHFLASREPEDLNALEAAGITDDFTMGYADTAGFRLGTCRPVPWFDPVAKRLTGLTLHPMTIMECTLDMTKYMNLDYKQAKSVCHALLAEVRKHNGEAVLLWHNTELSEQAKASGSYQRRLYLDVLNQLKGGS
jgi:hypothetical protein